MMVLTATDVSSFVHAVPSKTGATLYETPPTLIGTDESHSRMDKKKGKGNREKGTGEDVCLTQD